MVLNTGLTISDSDYNGDYAMPRFGDIAVLKIKDPPEPPEIVWAGLFDESWKLPDRRNSRRRDAESRSRNNSARGCCRRIEAGHSFVMGPSTDAGTAAALAGPGTMTKS